MSPLEATSVQLSTWLSETQDIPRALSCPISCQLPWAVGTVKCSQQGCAYQEADYPSSCQGSNWVFTMTLKRRWLLGMDSWSPDGGPVEETDKGKAHSAGLWCGDTLGRTSDLSELGIHSGYLPVLGVLMACIQEGKL